MTYQAPPELRHFIWQQGFALGAIQFDTLIEDFQKQMCQGKKRQSSLAMLDSHLHIPEQLAEQKKIISIDAGGSNLRCALVYFKQGSEGLQACIEEEKHVPMPGSDIPLDKKAFFYTLFKIIEPLLNKSDAIGFCFSYPCEISEQVDGKLLRWTKEVQAKGVEQSWIGKELNQVISDEAYPKKKITLLNDTVSTLLASLINTHENKAQAHIGLILGTGTNCAYSDYQGNIINIESGTYDGVINSHADELLDQNCRDQGNYNFEKKIAGKYLGDLCLQLLILATQEELLSTGCSQSISAFAKAHDNHMDTQCLNDLSSSKQAIFSASEDDNHVIAFLAQAVLEKAALLSAMQLAAIGQYQYQEYQQHRESEDDTSRQFNILVSVEGSTFYQLHTYQSRIMHYLNMMNRNYNIAYTFIKIEKASLLGATVAALSQGGSL